MKYIFADAIDVVDPHYDFLNDRNGPNRKPDRDDRYPHEMLDVVPCDGVLISRGIVGDHKIPGKYSTTQRMRFLRVGARAFLRLESEQFRNMLLFGDCGAFSFAKLDEPPYSAEEMVDFYGDGRFTHGCAVDHVIFDFDREGSKMQGGSEEARRRFDITLRNASQFSVASRALGPNFTPVGVVRAGPPGSMAEAARRLERMGYTYLALGGMVPLNAISIHAVLKAVRRVISPSTRIHLLGFAKAEQIGQFFPYGIESFDSTSPLIRAFKDSRSNYYVLKPDGGLDYYTAIRVPQATENSTLIRAAKEGKLRQEDLLSMESRALALLRSYDKGGSSVEPVLEAVLDYNRVMIEAAEGATPSTERQMTQLRLRVDKTLRDRPWKQCACAICKATSIEVMIFRSSNRNKRRGFHNLAIYYEHLQRSFQDNQMGERLKYTAVKAQQSARHKVLTFAVRAQDVLRFAVIDRVGRSKEGKLSGFQRPQIANHINEIRDYLRQDDAVLPNPIVVAFVEGVSVKDINDHVAEITIDLTAGPPGSIVDGQQRISAIAGLPEKDFEVFVSAIVCNDFDELRRQFVLINNTRPLPKALIYELLPTVQGLPSRLGSRSFAAALTARLNYDQNSSLHGQIRQHTNPSGVIRDTAIQRVILNSASDGALRELGVSEEGDERGFSLISNFYAAVQEVFKDDWESQTPHTSRLVHGAGIVALGYVMEALYSRDGSIEVQSFKGGLAPLVGMTAWRNGHWEFGVDERRAWNSIQNISRDIMQLAHHLVGVIKRSSTRVPQKRTGTEG